MTSLTTKVDQLVLLHARMRALFERTTVNGLVRSFLDEYAKPSTEALRADPVAFAGPETYRSEDEALDTSPKDQAVP